MLKVQFRVFDDDYLADGLTAPTIASTAAVVTPPINLKVIEGGAAGIVFQVTSATGTPDIKIEYAVLEDNVEDIPTSSDSRFDDEPDIVASSATMFSIHPENLHSIDCAMKPCMRVAFKITGVNANPADTVLAKFIPIGLETATA